MTKTALITGASSGIGRELARIFAREGYDLALVARSQDKLESVCAELVQVYRVGARWLAKDLAGPNAAAEIAAWLGKEGLTVDVLVNNAGTQVYGLFHEVEEARTMDLLQVNMLALTQLTRRLLPGMLARGEGCILNLGSTGSYAPSPLNAAYCASKAYVLSFSQGLAAELVGTGVTVTALCPGATASEFANRHGMEDVRYFRGAMSPQKVAEAGYRALMSGRREVVPGLGNRLQVLAYRVMMVFFPLVPMRLFSRIARYVMGRER